MQDIFIVDEFKVIADRTNSKLQEAGFDLPVYYQYGHIKEINQRLQEYTQSFTHSDKKYPLIILLTDIPIVKDVPGFYGRATVRVLIATLTQPTYTSEERTESTFKPILYPIKREFLNQLFRYGQFVFETEPTYTATDCYFYGSQINDKNVFNDYVDLIELSNLQFNITNKTC